MCKRIKKCLIGAKYTAEIEELNSLGIETVLLPPNALLDDEINSHADILVFNCGNGDIITDSSVAGEIEPFLMNFNVIYCDDIKSPYPNDIKINGAIIGDFIICNKKYISQHILDFANEHNYTILHTNQGYTKCNLCVLNESAAITEDAGLACLLNFYQIDVLKIKPGYVNLSDKHHGFIGGAGCMISDNELYISGDITSHPDYELIIGYLHKYNINVIFNKNRPLNDFGGFIPIY